MIGRLRGELVMKNPPQLMLDVGGVGYELDAPMSTFYALPEVGEVVALFTHLQVREDAHVLFGFISDTERRLFRDLLKVTGIGARIALAVLSGMEAGMYWRCIQEGNTAALIRLPGIGRKTAERLIVEMRDRADAVAFNTGPADAHVGSDRSTADPAEDAVHALIALGYKPQEASRMVNRIDAQNKTREDIIRIALKASLS